MINPIINIIIYIALEFMYTYFTVWTDDDNNNSEKKKKVYLQSKQDKKK